MMDKYLMQCEKAIKTRKKTKMLKAKLEQLQRERENAALAQANSPTKAANTEPTPGTSTTSTTIAKASEQKEKGKRSKPKEKRKGGKEDKQKHSKEEPVAISSVQESEPELMIEGREEDPQTNAGTGPTAQTTSANARVAPLEIGVSFAEEIEQQEQEAEEDGAEVIVPTPK